MAARGPFLARWANLLVLMAFGWLAIQIELAPLGGAASATPAPDLLFCVAGFLALRRPAESPAALILILGLARDLLGGGPAGLGAIALLIGTAIMRAAAEALRRRTLLHELALVAAAILAMTVIEALAMTLTLAPTPPLDVIGLGALTTFVAYLGVGLLLHWVLRIRRAPLETRLSLSRARP